MPRLTHILYLAVACGSVGCRNRHPLPQLTISNSELPADGREHIFAVLHGGRLDRWQASDLPSSSLRIEQSDGDATVFLRTPVLPAKASLLLGGHGFQQRVPVAFTIDNKATLDGTPDWMRLHTESDRRAFRRWFTEFADRAADIPSSQLPAEVTDCASLIRYAYHEALRRHDDRWYAQFPTQALPVLSSVQQWSYPDTPLGPNLFRVRQGPFQPADLKDGAFAQFADAKTLRADNAFLVGRDLKLARPGDLIFYRVLQTDSQYHSMIVTGEHGEWVVYNTGPDHGRHGEMRRVLLADLLQHPDPQWRPQASNPNWLGVYRWNILREE